MYYLVISYYDIRSRDFYTLNKKYLTFSEVTKFLDFFYSNNNIRIHNISISTHY